MSWSVGRLSRLEGNSLGIDVGVNKPGWLARCKDQCCGPSSHSRKRRLLHRQWPRVRLAITKSHTR